MPHIGSQADAQGQRIICSRNLKMSVF